MDAAIAYGLLDEAEGGFGDEDWNKAGNRDPSRPVAQRWDVFLLFTPDALFLELLDEMHLRRSPVFDL